MSSNARTLLKGKQVLTRAELADFLNVLADQIREGDIDLSLDGQRVRIRAEEQIGLSVEVKDTPKSGHVKRELELEMWWSLAERQGSPSSGVQDSSD
ncbi:amphi-Trp domain-containing protein [Nesterenkonia sp. YGD6]|uniref:amphi-Trp domain-containing protein n=1 Tax=Nesterenkonia sp. YGD6 TaxID=2901231 RepID=UPI001F4C6E95|nr:amphi-Trp domain-containing protein [Nesterenkonia sp. YGD6]MCH8562990.1 amphi-Trp domain-containing protein [Nesterenkonia sp. YGD6]